LRARFANIRAVRVDGTVVPSELPSSDRLERSVSSVLDDTALCAWASVSSDDRAHINTGYFARSEDLKLCLLSHPSSLHCRNIVTNPSMAVAVYASAQHWTAPGRGLQMFGACTQVAGDDARQAERTYVNRFPAYADWKAGLKPGDPALDYRFYQFVPVRVKILDEGEFGDAVWVQADIVRDQPP
jgi:uncharacterized protein YhbP (UPF0306 family)